MERAIKLAYKSVSEPGNVAPKVGAIVARDGKIIGQAYRGELNPGDHAEFTVFEKKLQDNTLAGATLFTTLEPCTSRSHSKLPCAEWVIERRIARVFIGTLDRNPRIRGNGELKLRDAGIQVLRFDPDLMPIIEEMNREFSRQFTKEKQEQLKTDVEALGSEIARLIETIKVERVEVQKSMEEQISSLSEKIQRTMQTASEILYDDNSEELDYLKYADGQFPGSRGGVASFTDTIVTKVMDAADRPMTLAEISQSLDQYRGLFKVPIDVANCVRSLVDRVYLVERQDDGQTKYELAFNGWKISNWQ